MTCILSEQAGLNMLSISFGGFGWLFLDLDMCVSLGEIPDCIVSTATFLRMGDGPGWGIHG